MRHDRYDLVIVGMGSGGSTAAEFTRDLGLSVAAVERDRLGGDCLWTGCVPSKSLIASARAAHAMSTADRLGIPAVDPDVDLRSVWKRIHAVQREVEDADDNAARWERLGVDLFFGDARLADPHTVVVGDRRLHTRFVLLATGSTPRIPPIGGLGEAGFLTTDNLFGLDDPPGSLVCVGGGTIAIEIAQAVNRLGVDTQVIEIAPQPLGREEPLLAGKLLAVLRAEGVLIDAGVTPEHVEKQGAGKVLHAGSANGPVRYEAEQILVATGRRPRVDGLGLEEVGVEVGDSGIRTDDRLRTAVESIYAVGDVAGHHQFTHSASYEAATAVRNMFLPLHQRANAIVPWCTFTDPELAHAGLTEEEARERHGRSVRVYESDLGASDRARADATTGWIRLVCARRRLVGAHILAPGAGELISELTLAIEGGMKVDELAALVHVYPTYATAVQNAAAGALRQRLRKYSWLARLGRFGR